MHLTESETKVLKAIRDGENTSLRNIGNMLDPPVSKNAVVKTLARLVKKGALRKKIVYSRFQVTPLGFSLLDAE